MNKKDVLALLSLSLHECSPDMSFETCDASALHIYGAMLAGGVRFIRPTRAIPAAFRFPGDYPGDSYLDVK